MRKLVFIFKNGASCVFEKNQWTDYTYDGKFFSVINNEKYIAMYNADQVFSVELSE